MQPLTHQVWAKHYVELRPHVIQEWPYIEPMELDVVGDDFDGLVELVQRTTGLTADDVHQRLRTLDVDELGLGSGEQPDDGAQGHASLDQLRVGSGFAESERDAIVARLQKLNRRLKRFPADGTDLELSVKDRDTTKQSVTLECSVPGFSRFVATSRETDLRDALMDVREDLWRQVDDAVTKRTQASR